MARLGRLFGLALVVMLAGCGSGGGKEVREPSSPADDPSPTPTIQDVMKLADDSLEPGTYFIDPDLNPSTSLRVVYEVAADGWSMWLGATKSAKEGHVAVSITTVANLVVHGCRDHSAADPPVGPTIDDLATALADLAPFQVTSPPTDITIYGYRGKHLELTVPDLPIEGSGDHRRFAGCGGGNLKSWIDPLSETEEGDAFYGYTGPGYTEEFWILDVEGTRLMIAAERSRGSPSEDIVEMRAILHSIRIEP
jgi:hypothetical protein